MALLNWWFSVIIAVYLVSERYPCDIEPAGPVLEILSRKITVHNF